MCAGLRWLPSTYTYTRAHRQTDTLAGTENQPQIFSHCEQSVCNSIGNFFAVNNRKFGRHVYSGARFTFPLEHLAHVKDTWINNDVTKIHLVVLLIYLFILMLFTFIVNFECDVLHSDSCSLLLEHLVYNHLDEIVFEYVCQVVASGRRTSSQPVGLRLFATK